MELLWARMWAMMLLLRGWGRRGGARRHAGRLLGGLVLASWRVRADWRSDAPACAASQSLQRLLLLRLIPVLHVSPSSLIVACAQRLAKPAGR